LPFVACGATAEPFHGESPACCLSDALVFVLKEIDYGLVARVVVGAADKAKNLALVPLPNIGNADPSRPVVLPLLLLMRRHELFS